MRDCYLSLVQSKGMVPATVPYERDTLHIESGTTLDVAYKLCPGLDIIPSFAH